jgi:hypothetical protein
LKKGEKPITIKEQNINNTIKNIHGDVLDLTECLVKIELRVTKQYVEISPHQQPTNSLADTSVL